MSTSAALREIFAAGRPLVEEWLDIAEQIAALRDAATEKGLDWSQLKALMKAQIQDERDGTGEGKRVRRIVEKAEFASAYADMLGLANMNENNFSPNSPETAHEAPSDEKRRPAATDGQTGTDQQTATSAGRKIAGVDQKRSVTAGETAQVPNSLPSPSTEAKQAGEGEPLQSSPATPDFTRSASPGVEDGQRCIPSSEAGGAKMDGGATLSPDRADDQSVNIVANSERAVKPSAMTAKTQAELIRLLRPNCRHADDLEKCGGQGSKHCHSCQTAAREVAA